LIAPRVGHTASDAKSTRVTSLLVSALDSTNPVSAACDPTYVEPTRHEGQCRGEPLIGESKPVDLDLNLDNLSHLDSQQSFKDQRY
jgi:hypothetical protein